MRRQKETHESQKTDLRTLWIGGVVCGAVLFGASSLQQMGIQFTSVGKSGFITACYIVLVPIFSLFLGRKCSWLVAISVVLAVAGLYLLCMTEALRINAGDALTLGSAVLYSLHILVVDAYAPRVDCVKLSCIQFFMVSLCALIAACLTETVTKAALMGALIPILYAGIFSCGVGYTLQTVAQKGLDPTIASLIMSLESCVSVLAGWAILGQSLSARELCGCAAMLAAIVLAQLPTERRTKEAKRAMSIPG